MRELEARFAEELVVIGVHSGKFRSERVTANIAAAAQRLRADHPVVNDRQFRIWRAYGVGAWPTAVLLDPAGGIAVAVPGEFLAGQLVPLIEDLSAEFDREDAPCGARLRRGPWPLRLPSEPGGPLAFPGRVLAMPGGRLFVSDTGHDRILELQLEAEGSHERGGRATVVRVVGSGRRGATDGAAGQASFDHPQGLALTAGRLTEAGLAPADGVETLFAADAENHTVRAIALPTGEVTTLTGTGHQARRYDEAGVGRGAALSSPWDVELLPVAHDGAAGPGAAKLAALVIAMAGAHQLWRLDLVTGAVEPWIGTGREDLSDGPPSRCTLAQPMGVQLIGRRLYFADSESSAVRVADLDGRDGPEVETIVGRGLFEFGDEDGQGGHARLQHPYDLAAGPGPGGADVLYVADTYNDRVKLVDPATRRSDVFAGSGEPGHEDGDAGAARFWGPQGVAVADGRVFVADTNNHALRVVELSGDAPVVRTLEIAGWGRAGPFVPRPAAARRPSCPVRSPPVAPALAVIHRAEDNRRAGCLEHDQRGHMPYCSSCGRPLTGEGRFCAACGAPQAVAPPPAAQHPAPHPAPVLPGEAPSPPPSARQPFPGWAVALFVVLALCVIAAAAAFVLPLFILGGIVSTIESIDASPGVDSAAGVRTGVRTIEMGIEAWRVDNAQGAYPPEAVVTPAGLGGYVDPWPVNPCTGGPMQPGGGPGGYDYVRLPEGEGYTLTGYGDDGAPVLTVP